MQATRLEIDLYCVSTSVNSQYHSMDNAYKSMEEERDCEIEMQREVENIIEIKDAYKRYSPSNVILRGLNMTVAKGTIYGLLGPSGCGKTTLLGCIAGRHPLDAGAAAVRLDSVGQLGYMPQEIALMELFTVGEMVEYFGRLAGLRPAEAALAGRALLDMVRLPPATFYRRQICDMSGGQQRRVSLVVALLHDPVLLILDEPTVGLDPLINQKLWEYFLEITEVQGKTIIITTHYIEEARHAHMIGLMRNGVLLAEASPARLLAQYDCDALEDVFLLLSHRQNADTTHTHASDNDTVYPKGGKCYAQFGGRGRSWDRQRAAAQVYKNACWARRNVPMLVFMLALPGVMSVLFCVVLTDSLNTPLAAVTNDSCQDSPLSFSPPLPPCKPQSRYSCRLLELIARKSYTIVEHGDEASAAECVRGGGCRAALVFRPNYSWSLIRRLKDGVQTIDRYVNSSAVTVHIDMSDMIIGNKMKRDIRTSFSELVDLVAHDCRYDSRLSKLPLQFKTPIFGDRDPKFTVSAIAGYIIPVAFYFTSLFSASSIASEKISGFLERCLVSGVQQTEIFFAHTVTQVCMVFGQNIVLLSIVYLVFVYPVKGSFALIIAIICITELQGMFFGFAIGILFDEENMIAYVTVGTVICMFLSCGMVWPVEGVHWLIRPLLEWSPIVMAVEAYRSVTLRGWSLSHPRLVTAFIANLFLALALFAVFVIISKSKNR